MVGGPSFRKCQIPEFVIRNLAFVIDQIPQQSGGEKNSVWPLRVHIGLRVSQIAWFTLGNPAPSALDRPGLTPKGQSPFTLSGDFSIL
jgi:hypothetical protein